MSEYFIDYTQELLKINLDYPKEISLEIVKDKETAEPVAVIKYLGTDERAGATIVSNLEKILKIKKEDERYNLYLGDECFAHFKETEGKFSLDENLPQQHLTSFELRMLARKNVKPQIFSRKDISGIKRTTDLHTHFAGDLSPEDLIKIGKKHDVLIKDDLLYGNLHIDIFRYKRHLMYKTEAGEEIYGIKLNDLSPEDLQKYTDSMRIPPARQETFNKMEEIYNMRGAVTKNVRAMPDLLRRSAEINSKDGVKYIEFSLSSVIRDTRVLEIIHKELPEIEKETGCKIRFLGSLWRYSDKEWNLDEVDHLKKSAQSPYVTGVDVMGHEANPTTDFYEELAEITKWAAINDPDFTIRVHAGENALFKNNVRDALQIIKDATKEAEIETGRPLKYPKVRIGHGLYGIDEKEDCLRLCKELDAVIEFNPASNLSLNNVDNIKEIPIKKYKEYGIKFIIGSDGRGIYSTDAEQDIILAHAAGASKEDLLKLIKFEEEFVTEKDEYYARKTEKIEEILKTGQSFKEIFKPEYSTPDGKPRYNEGVEERKRQKKKELQEFLDSEIARIGAETNPEKVAEVMSNKMPILITGASVKAWPDISKENQDEIRTAMQVLANVIDPKKAYIMTGGTNHGVEKQMHEAVYSRNSKNPTSKLAVVGTLTEEAAKQDLASIEKNTITHAIVLSLNGRLAERWFDLPDTVLNVVAEQNGEMIAVGGGGIVRDMIQRAHNMGMNVNLMEGPEGASTDKAQTMPDYAFSGAKGLIERLYTNRPDIFISEFDINKLDKYVFIAQKEQRENLRMDLKRTAEDRTPPNGNNKLSEIQKTVLLEGQIAQKA